MIKVQYTDNTNKMHMLHQFS